MCLKDHVIRSDGSATPQKQSYISSKRINLTIFCWKSRKFLYFGKRIIELFLKACNKVALGIIWIEPFTNARLSKNFQKNK